MVKKIQAVIRGRLTQQALDREERLRLKRRRERKKRKLTQRKRIKASLKRMKRKALKHARWLNSMVAYFGSILFICVAFYLNLIYAVKFQPSVAMVSNRGSRYS